MIEVRTGRPGIQNGFENKQRLQTIGVERLTLPEMQSVAASFCHDLRAGLEKKPSSLATIPTLLKPVDLTTILPNKRALVVEMGGTNIAGGLVSVKDGVNLSDYVHVQYDETKNKQYASSNDFFAEVARAMPPLEGEIDALGIIWSFPADISQYKGIDAISFANLPKGLFIANVADQYVGDQLLDALREKNPTISPDLSRAVANDTAAVLVANGGVIGGVVGTGFNLAFSHNGQIYNLEAGDFKGIPETFLSKEIDMESENPRHYLAEKQISGKNVYQLFTKSAQELGLITTQEFSAADMSQLLAGNAEDILQKAPHLSPDNLFSLQEQAAILRDRSAQLVASMVAGAVLEFPEDFPSGDIRVPIEGSFFEKTPKYKEIVERYIKELCPERNISFYSVSQSGIKGAGVAALTLIS